MRKKNQNLSPETGLPYDEVNAANEPNWNDLPPEDGGYVDEPADETGYDSNYDPNYEAAYDPNVDYLPDEYAGEQQDIYAPPPVFDDAHAAYPPEETEAYVPEPTYIAEAPYAPEELYAAEEAYVHPEAGYDDDLGDGDEPEEYAFAEDFLEEAPRPRSIFNPRTRRPNFVLAVAVNSAKLMGVLVLVAALAGLGVLLGIAKAYVETAPTLNFAKLDDQDKTSFLYDAQGNLITDYKGTENRVMVSIDEIPKTLQNAFVAVEDARFFTHNGVDVKRIIGAFVANLSSGSNQGGSTITQQLIKQTVLSDELSYKRKLQEAYLAMQLESRYTKEQILENYLNTIFLGGNYYGVKVASEGYFGKDMSQLTLRECAMLAGMTRSPNYYDPRKNFYTRNIEGAETAKITNDRTDYVLRQMYENQFISKEEYDAALNPMTAQVLETSPGAGDEMYKYVHYVEYAVNDVINTFLKLNNLEDTAANRYAMENKLRTGGYHVYLCVDPQVQTIVEETLVNWDNYPRMRNPSDSVSRPRNSDGTYTEVEQPQAAAVVMDYRTGELVAVVGGRYVPTQRKTLNRAYAMNMPVGSSIKPISVYAPAIDMGASPASIVYNIPVPITGWRGSDGQDTWPQNYGGGGYTGAETFREALRKSNNTSTAQALAYYVGIEQSAQYLRNMGVADQNIDETLFGLSLGSSGLTPVQMAVSFGTLANKGVYQQPLSFSRITDSAGNVIVDARATQEKHQVFKPSTALLVTDMLKGAVASGTGTRAQIPSQVVAGKTGTNSDSVGVTFAGMTGWYSAALWIGHDDYKPLTSKATGGNDAAPLWQSFMERIHQEKALPNREIMEGGPEDYGLVKLTTCGVSGMLATEACTRDIKGYPTVSDYWAQENAPAAQCTMHQLLNVCTVSGLLAGDYCPPEVVEQRGMVLIPSSHPLYPYTGGYGNVISQYLGAFATVSGPNSINTHACDVHTALWQDTQAATGNQLLEEARAAVIEAYGRLNNAGDTIDDNTRLAVTNAIYAVESTLNGEYIDPVSLQNALTHLYEMMGLLP